MGEDDRDTEKEVCCMTAATRNNVYVFGKLKDPSKKIPAVSAKEIAEASKRIEEIQKKK